MAFDMTTALTIKANVVGQGQIKGLESGLGRVSKQTNRTAQAMQRLKGAAGGALGMMRSFLPVLGVAGVAAFAKSNLDAADAMSKLSQRTGVAAPVLDKFRKVADLNDTSIESLGKGFGILAKNMNDANNKGTGPAAEAFAALNVQLTDSSGKLRDTDQVMLELGDKFRQMEDGTQKAALASQIFGQRLGQEMIPMLNAGGDAVRNMSTAMTQEFADKAAAFNDRLTEMTEKLGELGLKLTEALLPFLDQLVDGIVVLAEKFQQLDQGTQRLILVLGGISAAALVFAPIISAVGSLIGLLGGLVPIITTITTALLSLGAAAVATLGLGGLALGGLIIAAIALIYRFRNEIFSAIKAIIGALQSLGKAFYSFFIEPTVKRVQMIMQFFADSFQRIRDFITSPIQSAANFIQRVFGSVVASVANRINFVVEAINRIIGAANRAMAAVGGPQLPFIPSVPVPAFAEGGVVAGPTLAMVGEGNEREYIVPESKMARASANYLAGLRGGAVVPRFAEGGVVVPNTGSVNIQTGPVTQMGGQDFVTTQDLSDAVMAGIDQTLQLLRRDGSIRSSLGLV
jgi:hypothetical protein